MEDSQQESKGLKDKISELRDLILIVSPAFLCVSFIFNFFYFYALEIQFEKIPLSTVDYIVTVNALIPSAFSIIILSFIYQANVYIKLKKCYKSVFPEAKTYDDETIREMIYVFFLTCIIILLFKNVFMKSIFNISYSTILFAFFYILIAIDTYHDIDITISRAIVIIATITIFTFACAVDLAHKTYNSTSSQISISGIQYYVMRSFNSGFLLRVPGKNELIFLTTNGVKINFQQSTDFLKKLETD